MEVLMTVEKNYGCILRLDDLYIEKIDFVRKDAPINGEPELEYSREIISNDNGTRSVRLSARGVYGNGTNFYIQMVGVFEVDAPEGIEEKSKEKLYTDNTVAIMFPYIRAQITLLTSQPGIAPFYMPPINIAGLLEEINTKE
jgi:preprotein translocase subunit SecB